MPVGVVDHSDRGTHQPCQLEDADPRVEGKACIGVAHCVWVSRLSSPPAKTAGRQSRLRQLSRSRGAPDAAGKRRAESRSPVSLGSAPSARAVSGTSRLDLTVPYFLRLRLRASDEPSGLRLSGRRDGSRGRSIQRVGAQSRPPPQPLPPSAPVVSAAKRSTLARESKIGTSRLRGRGREESG